MFLGRTLYLLVFSSVMLQRGARVSLGQDGRFSILEEEQKGRGAAGGLDPWCEAELPSDGLAFLCKQRQGHLLRAMNPAKVTGNVFAEEQGDRARLRAICISPGTSAVWLPKQQPRRKQVAEFIQG